MALSPTEEAAIKAAYQKAVVRILKSDSTYQQNQANFSALLGKIQNDMKISLPEFGKIAHTDAGVSIILEAFQSCREDGSLDFNVPVVETEPAYQPQNPWKGQGKRSAKELLSNVENHDPDAENKKLAENVKANVEYLLRCAENKRKLESGEHVPQQSEIKLPPHNVPETDARVQAFYANANTTAEQIRQWGRVRKNYVASGAPDEVVTG